MCRSDGSFGTGLLELPGLPNRSDTMASVSWTVHLPAASCAAVQVPQAVLTSHRYPKTQGRFVLTRSATETVLRCEAGSLDSPAAQLAASLRWAISFKASCS